MLCQLHTAGGNPRDFSVLAAVELAQTYVPIRVPVQHQWNQ
jgi:hypothetical protein